MPDIAAITTAINAVTTATPPRVRFIQILRVLYMSRAIPERSNNVAIKMNRRTEIST